MYTDHPNANNFSDDSLIIIVRKKKINKTKQNHRTQYSFPYINFNIKIIFMASLRGPCSVRESIVQYAIHSDVKIAQTFSIRRCYSKFDQYFNRMVLAIYTCDQVENVKLILFRHNYWEAWFIWLISGILEGAFHSKTINMLLVIQ